MVWRIGSIPLPSWGHAIERAGIYLVWSDGAFSFGRGLPGALQGPPLAARLDAALAARDRAALTATLDMEFSSGVFVGAEARIAVSTDPSRVGAVAFDPAALTGGGGVEIALTGFDGRTRVALWTPRPNRGSSPNSSWPMATAAFPACSVRSSAPTC